MKLPFELMHAKIGEASFFSNSKSNSDFIFEQKLDGYRACCIKKDSALAFISRTDNDWTKKYPEFNFAKNIKATECILDGEIVVLDDKGNISFALMQQRNENKKEATYIVFDILEKDGQDLRDLALLERKKILKETIVASKHLKVISYTSDGKKAWQHALKYRHEGIMAKKSDSSYESRRSPSWLKIKKTHTVDCVIIGYTQDKRAISSLALGLFNHDQLVFIGKVGTGFNDELVKSLKFSLMEIREPADSTYARSLQLSKDIIPVKPKYVCEIEYLEVTQDIKLRAPVFLRLREDKKEKECSVQQLIDDVQKKRTTHDQQSDASGHSKLSIQEYAKKRDFTKTKEPQHKPEKKPTSKVQMKPALFVIQKHDARRLHYDFRLELGGVLKSWAVPKGPSNNPQDKRLAVMTEDHPLSYANFKGRIPQGNYGAGVIEIWDKGRYVNITVHNGKIVPLEDAIRKGHFAIFLKGRKTNGTYTFARLGKHGKYGDTKDVADTNQWLLIKKNEDDEKGSKISLDDEQVTIGKIDVALTNLQKKLDDGIQKSDFVDYYRKIAPLMLKHIEGRPVSMYRFPDGIHGKKFFQKDTPSYFPEWFKRKPIAHKNSVVKYAIVENEAGIVYLGNQVIEPHVMLSRENDIEKPDKMVFDLDPSPDVPLKSTKKVALILKKFLDALNLPSFIMTTGGKGYHVAVPIKPELHADAVRSFALKIAETLVRQEPKLLTTHIRKELREEKIFIDVNRISPNQTAIAPYGARGRPGFPIACPFEWEDLPTIDPDSITIHNAPSVDAWQKFFKKSVSLKRIIERLKK